LESWKTGKASLIFCRHIKVEEVEEVMRKMSRGRAIGPDETPMEFCKDAGPTGLEWLLDYLMSLLGRKRCLKNGGGFL